MNNSPITAVKRLMVLNAFRTLPRKQSNEKKMINLLHHVVGLPMEQAEMLTKKERAACFKDKNRVPKWEEYETCATVLTAPKKS